MVHSNILKSYLRVISINLKIYLMPKLLMSIAFGIIIILGTDFTSNKVSLIPRVCQIEYSLIGVLLLTSVVTLELTGGIKEAVYPRNIVLYKQYFIRLILALISIAVLTAVFVGAVYLRKPNFNYLEIYLNTVLTTVFIGSLGLLVADIFQNSIFGYFFCFSVYLFELLIGERFNDVFYIFTLINKGSNFVPVLIMSIIFITLFILLEVNKKDIINK